MKHLNYLKQLLLPVLLLLVTGQQAFAVLNGTYTVYGSGANYADLNAAITDLNNQGVNGPVVFNIRAGAYTSNAWGVIGQIAGASSTNTITFQAESGPGTTTLSPSGSAYNNNGVFLLNNSNWIIIKDLTLNNTGTTNGADVNLIGSASNNTVQNCILTGNTGTSTTNFRSRIFAYWASMPSASSGTAGFTGANNRVLNCNIPAGCNYGIYIYGNTSATSHAGAFEITGNTIVGYYGALYGYFVNDVKFNNNTVTKNTAGSSQFYAVYMYESDSSMEVMNNTITTPSVGSTFYGVYRYYCDGSAAKKQVIANNTMSINNTSSSNYLYYYYSKHDSSVGNTMTGTCNSTMNGMYAYFCDYNKFKNNTLSVTGSGSFYPLYKLYGLASQTNALETEITGNNITATTSSSMYNYMAYYCNGLKFQNNIFNLNSTGSVIYNYYQYNMNYECSGNTVNATAYSACYGMYIYHNSSGNNFGKIFNNKINASSSVSTLYGMYCYYPGGVDIYNNSIVTRNTTSTNYTCALLYPGAGTTCNFYNNTVYNMTTGSSNYTFMIYSYSAYGELNIRNNVIAKSSANGSYFIYRYDDNTGKIKMDYNNLYTPSTSVFGYNAWFGTTWTNFPSWRAGTNGDFNSLSYPVAFVNPTGGDLTPDATQTNAWSMQGRGIHIPGNSSDIVGNPRPVITSTGVPDLGAYEFTPNSGVLPPVCTATPATPVAGGTQTFTIGYDTVATVAWDAAATVPSTAPTVRQYTGTIPPGLTTLNPTNMYFYTDIQTSPNADYVANIYYADPWIGTIASETTLHLAKKDGSNPWVGYATPGSGVNTNINYIFSPSSPKLNTYGLYTGIDVPNNAAAVEITEPSGAFCPGNYVVKVRIRNAGNNVINNVRVYYEVNGGPASMINHTTPIPYNNGTPGINDVILTLGTYPFGATPNTFKVYTSLPNNVVDPVPADDTLGPVSLRSALQGDYTVGGTTPDFPNVVTAVAALKTAGMCGAVTFKVRQGTYVGNVDLTGIVGSSAANRLTIRADDNVAASAVNITYGATGTADNYVIRLNNMSFVTLKNLSITATGPTYGYVIHLNGTSNEDSIIGCNLTAGNTLASTNLCGIFANGTKCTNLKIYNNNITASTGSYLYAPSYTDGLEIVGNNFSCWYYGMLYMYQYNGVKVNYNKIISASPATTASPYGLYYAYQSGSGGPSEFIGNKIDGFYYGAYYLYNWGSTSNANRTRILNNVITYSKTSQTMYASMYLVYPRFTTVANNTLTMGGPNYTSGYCGYILFGSYSYDSCYNNVFANYAQGYAMYSYLLSGYNNYCDYNNLYTTGSTLVYDAGYGSSANLGTWRTTTPANNVGGADKNSISYDPGLDRTTGMPDITNPNSWTMHGRGRHSATTALDITGSPRPLIKEDGVPDLGAYEFEPSVAPPNAVGAPAIPAPGLTQTFTLGYTNVATVAWNTQLALTSPLQVKPYSGVVAPANFMAVSQNKYPYFYVGITPTGLGSGYDFNLTVNYYDTWLGKIPSETNMKLAHKFPTHPTWTSYNAANSSTNATNNTIYAAGVINFGAFTGIDDGVHFSATIKAVGSIVMCTGKTVTLNANPVSGGSSTYTYQWKRNGVDIPGATTATYIASTGGDYTVAVTATSVFPNITSEAIPVPVTVVAPPMALIAANGPLTYCIGNGLTLSAPTGSGLNYRWTLNGSNLGTSATQGVTSAGSYRVIVTNIGCSDTSDATIINAGPINVNLGTDIAGCEIKGTPYILDAGYPGAKYMWSTGDTTQTIEVYKGMGVYSVTVDAGPNCNGTDQVAVNLDPLPSVSGISFMRNGNTYQFSASSPKNVKSYLWIFNDGTTSTYPVVNKTFDASMTVKLVIKNDCGNDTVSLVNWATAVNNTVNENLEANVYPNPAKDIVTFAVTGAIMKDVTVINALGEVVYRAEMGGTAKEASINVSSFAAGRYIIRSTTTEGIVSKPFNVQR